MPRPLALSLLLAACAADPSTTDDGDTDAAADDTDAVAGDCTQSIALALASAPAVLGRQPVTWEDQAVTLTTEPYQSGLVAEHEGDCLWLHPGLLRVDLRHTRCGADEVRARIVDACGSTCSRLDVYVVDTPAGQDRNTRTGAEDELALATTTTFTSLTFSTLDARLCGLDVGLAPLPVELQPEDTAALF